MNSVAICTVKDEAHYLLEWIAYYRSFGFKHVLIATNNNSDCTYDMLEKLSAVLPWFHWINNDIKEEGHAPQLRAYRLCTEWLLDRKFKGLAGVFDSDEFLLPAKGETLSDLWEQYPGADCVSFNWRIFGSNGHATKTPGLVIERFDKAAPEDINAHFEFKSLFRVDSHLTYITPHYPQYADEEQRVFLMADGEPMDPKARLDQDYRYHSRRHYKTAQVNHYMLRSRQEFDAKKLRGRGPVTKEEALEAPRHDDEFFKRFDLNYVAMPMSGNRIVKTRVLMKRLYKRAGLDELQPMAFFGL